MKSKYALKQQALDSNLIVLNTKISVYTKQLQEISYKLKRLQKEKLQYE